MSAKKIIQLDSFNRIAVNRRPRRILLVALVVTAAVGLYRWILEPYGGQLLAAQKYDFTLSGVLSKAGNLSAALEEKKAKVDELTAKSERLRDELFTPVEAREFFASLPAVAKRSGCVIQSVSSPADQRIGSSASMLKGSGIVEKKAVVTCAGGYGSIAAFIEELQRYQRKVWIDTVRIETGGDSSRLKCRLTLTLYCVDDLEMASYE